MGLWFLRVRAHDGKATEWRQEEPRTPILIHNYVRERERERNRKREREN